MVQTSPQVFGFSENCTATAVSVCQSAENKREQDKGRQTWTLQPGIKPWGGGGGEAGWGGGGKEDTFPSKPFLHKTHDGKIPSDPTRP